MDRPLDETDRKLLALLRADARRPAATLAAVLGVSRGTVQNRIERLLSSRVIEGFTIRLRDQAPDGVRAVTLVAVQGPRLRAVIRTLRGMPEVEGIYRTNGRWDAVAVLHAPTLAGFDRALALIGEVPGVAGTETHLLLAGE